jgi:flagellar protein FliO/FliZ
MSSVIARAPLAAAVLILSPLAEAIDKVPSPAPVGPADVFSLGTGLILVIAAILVTGWLYKRTQGLRGGSNEVIRIVASQALGTRERVILLQVADQQLLVGMTSSQVQTLHVFDSPVVIATEPSVGFAERLRAAVKGQGK